MFCARRFEMDFMSRTPFVFGFEFDYEFFLKGSIVYAFKFSLSANI